MFGLSFWKCLVSVQLKTRLGDYGKLLSKEDLKPVLETTPAAVTKPAKMVTLGGGAMRAMAAG
jgi:hypothetical protein